MQHKDVNEVDEGGRRSFLEQSIAMLLAAGATAAPALASAQQESQQKSPPKGSTLRFFPGFEAFRLDAGEAVINGVKGGNGPPLLLMRLMVLPLVFLYPACTNSGDAAGGERRFLSEDVGISRTDPQRDH